MHQQYQHREEGSAPRGVGPLFCVEREEWPGWLGMFLVGTSPELR